MNYDFRGRPAAPTALFLHLPQPHLPPPGLRQPSLVRHAPTNPAAAEQRRTRIWDLHTNLHCSIIGTCLSAAELRQIMARIGLNRPDLSDHELHIEGVRIAARHDATGKILHKALDQRHHTSIKRASGARTAEALALHWMEGVRNGEIPGTYWAVLTHPATTEALIKQAFGDVHMLSHLVGSANRADLRRLCQLEAEKATLEDKLQRQQTQLRDAVISRDATIRELRESLVAQVSAAHPSATMPGGDGAPHALESCVADLQRQIGVAIRRREAIEKRHGRLREALSQEEAAHQFAERQLTQVSAELRALEASLLPADAAAPETPDLAGLTLLYVGGRPHQIPSLRAMVQRSGAGLLHHDGGIEESSLLLAGLIARADIVVFPVDCISHEAALAVKRMCRQQAKRFLPLRSSGAGALIAALSEAAAHSQ
jgi:hypothetical protein